MLRLEAGLSPTLLRLGAAPFQEVELVSHRHWCEKLTLQVMGF